MSAQAFSPATYSPDATCSIPAEAPEADDDRPWQEYCHVAATLDRQHILDVVLSSLDAEDSPLFELIDDALQYPHEPGRPKANLMDLARVGKAVLHLVAKAIDEQVTLRIMGDGVSR